MIDPVASPFLVPFVGAFDAHNAPTLASELESKKSAKKKLAREVEAFSELQRRLAAADKHSVLLIFQALDAAGKDSTIRAVTTGVNPAGIDVSAFKAPSDEELSHDFLWRSARRLPGRGQIGIFNRSYYEEVLVVRVHPEYLGGQRVPVPSTLDQLWEQRFESIRSHEKHLAENGTLILKFWLNVSRDEQARRFLSRLEEPAKNWKFAAGDLKERARWDDYLDAFGAALSATSRPWAPWYAIPADDKPNMRLGVAQIIVEALTALDPRYPEMTAEDREDFPRYAEALLAELEGSD
jgi:PPK2 family polyphosphate:nucleotide phosphotransferase